MAFSDRLRDKFRPYKKQKEGDGTSSVKTQMSALEDGEDWSSSDEKYEVVDDGVPSRRRKCSDSSHGSSDGKGSGGKRVSWIREEFISEDQITCLFLCAEIHLFYSKKRLIKFESIVKI